jgi:hypothetical protein
MEDDEPSMYRITYAFIKEGIYMVLLELKDAPLFLMISYIQPFYCLLQE